MPERLWLWWVATRIIFSRAYPGAAYAVRKVAQDTSLYAALTADPRGAKILLGNRAAAYPMEGEDLARVTEAREWARAWLRDHGRTSRLTELNALVELSYLAYSRRT